MKSISLKMFYLLVLAGLTASVPATHAAAQWNEREDGGKTLEGTWITQVTLLDCQSHSALGPPFISMGSFARGGTMTETTSSPAFFPGTAKPRPRGMDPYRPSLVQVQQHGADHLEWNTDQDSDDHTSDRNENAGRVCHYRGFSPVLRAEWEANCVFGMCDRSEHSV